MTFGMDFSSYKDRKKIFPSIHISFKCINSMFLGVFNQAADKIHGKE